ncbi:hypothetical protein V6N13_087965 [Hibiscus sabdariffa]
MPEILGTMKHLMTLDLSGTALKELPSSMENLIGLSHLPLENCENLVCLPDSFCKLKHLFKLCLGGCSRLEKFPEIMETMEHLRTLDLSGTALKELPSSLENLIGLSQLTLENCENLVCLPDSFYRLKSLRELYLGGCSRLEKLPEILETMEHLTTLDLSGTASKELSSSMENLIGLSRLTLENCGNLVCLLDSFYKLKSLRELYLGGCSSLENFPEILEAMEMLRILDVSGTALKELPSSMDNLIVLNHLRLDKCENLIHLPDNLFSAIGGASLTGGSEIQKYRVGLSLLKVLSLRECRRLKSLPVLPPNLELLDAPGCTSLEDVSSIKRHFEKVLANDYHQALHWRDHFMACIPGSEIPDWFDFKSLGSSITIPVPWEWYDNSWKNFHGFVVSAVVSFQDYSGDVECRIGCECHLKSSNGHCLDLTFFSADIWGLGMHHGGNRLIGSDHLFLFCNDYIFREFVETQASNEFIYKEASFKLYAEEVRWPHSSWKVKQFGVHPLFANEGGEVLPPSVKYGN